MGKVKFKNIMAYLNLGKECITVQWNDDDGFNETYITKQFDTIVPWVASKDFDRDALKEAFCQFVDEIIVK